VAADDERVSTPGAYWIVVSIGTVICVRFTIARMEEARSETGDVQVG